MPVTQIAGSAARQQYPGPVLLIDIAFQSVRGSQIYCIVFKLLIFSWKTFCSFFIMY